MVLHKICVFSIPVFLNSPYLFIKKPAFLCYGVPTVHIYYGKNKMLFLIFYMQSISCEWVVFLAITCASYKAHNINVTLTF